MSHRIHLAVNPPRFIKGGIRLASQRDEPMTPFRWPLDALGGLLPRVLAAHDGGRPSVDLGYERTPLEIVPVLAANDGEVSLAIEGGSRYAVSLDHSGAWMTHYTGLSKLAVIPCLPRRKLRQSVGAGDVIGYATSKLGFELWRWTDDRGFVPVGPRSHLACWAVAPVKTEATSKEAA
jgi:hypothetical protein